MNPQKSQFTTLVCLLLMALTLVVPSRITAQNYRFTHQSVNMKIEHSFFFVSGLYFLKGTPGTFATITFPLPHGNAYGPVDSLHIYDVTKSIDIIPDDWNERAVNFTVRFEESEEYLFQLYYRLKLLSNKAEYNFSNSIASSDHFEKACFYLISPAGYEMSRFTYLPKDTLEAGSNTLYFWEMYDFSPQGNLEFRFRDN